MPVLLIVIATMLALLIVLVIVFRPKANNNLYVLSNRMDELQKRLDQLTSSLREDFKTNREENAQLAGQNRKELNDTLLLFRQEMQTTLQMITTQNRNGMETISKTLDEKISALVHQQEASNREARETATADWKDFSLVQRTRMDDWKAEQKEGTKQMVEQLDRINRHIEEKLLNLQEQAKTDGHLNRSALEASFKGFRENFTQSVEGMNNLQREKFGLMEDRQNQLVQATEKKLEHIRETVEEKLQKTLHDRLGQSFELVRGQLESVQKGLGE